MNVTLTIVLAEICLVLLAVIVVISFKAWNCRRRGKAAVDTLVTSIQAHKTERVEKLAGMLKESGQLSDSDALGKANELIKKQNKFYQDAIDLYFTRNHEVLSKLDNRMEDLLNQYQGLFKGGGDEGAAETDNAAVEQLSKDIAALSKELEALRSENANLTSQLKAAEHELDQLGQEYVSAFNKPKENKKRQAADVSPEEERGEDGADSDEEAPVTASAEGAQEVAIPDDAGVEQAPAAEASADAPAETEAMVEADEIPMLTETAEEAPAQRDKAAESVDDALLAGDDGGEEQGLLTDLDLEELLGEQPDKAKDDETADGR